MSSTKKLIKATEDNNIIEVKRLLNRFIFKPNKKAIESAINISIKNDNFDLVKILLQKNKIPLDNYLYYAKNSKSNILGLLISKGLSINSRVYNEKSKYISLLIYEIETKNIELAEFLINNGADVGTKESVYEMKEKLPLNAAIDINLFSVAKLLIKKGAVNNKYCDDGKILYVHNYIRKGDKNIVDLLLLIKGNISIINEYGQTPLHVAVENNRVEFIDLLISKGANIDKKDNNKTTPLMIAIREKNIEVAKKLIDLGAKIEDKPNNFSALLDACSSNDIEFVEYLLSKGTDINFKDTNEDTPLSVALKNSYEIAKILILKGGDVNITNKYNQSPLHFACEFGEIELIEAIIEKVTDINLKDFKGDTPLLIAINKNKFDLAKLLILKGADVNICNNDNVTALHVASSKGNIQIVELLTKKGANKEVENKHYEKPISLAIVSGNLNLVKFLIDCTTDLDNKNEYNKYNYPLNIAIKNGHIDIVNWLISIGADVNYKNFDENTPIHFACQVGSIDIVKVLVENGAELNVKNNQRLTPIQLSFSCGHIEIIDYLLSYGIKIENNFDTKHPINLALENGFEEVVLEFLPKITIAVSQLPFLFQKSIIKGYAKVVSYIINKYSSYFNKTETLDDYLTDSQIGGKRSYLYQAVWYGHSTIVSMLLTKYSPNNIGYRDNYIYEYPIHCATFQQNISILNILINNGANVNIKNSKNETPLNIAANLGNNQMIELLISKGASA